MFLLTISLQLAGLDTLMCKAAVKHHNVMPQKLDVKQFSATS